MRRKNKAANTNKQWYATNTLKAKSKSISKPIHTGTKQANSYNKEKEALMPKLKLTNKIITP
jgi:hypothetical protein